MGRRDLAAVHHHHDRPTVCHLPEHHHIGQHLDPQPSPVVSSTTRRGRPTHQPHPAASNQLPPGPASHNDPTKVQSADPQCPVQSWPSNPTPTPHRSIAAAVSPQHLGRCHRHHPLWPGSHLSGLGWAYTDHNRAANDERLPPDEAEMSTLHSPGLNPQPAERQPRGSFGSTPRAFTSSTPLLTYRTQAGIDGLSNSASQSTNYISKPIDLRHANWYMWSIWRRGHDIYLRKRRHRQCFGYIADVD